MASRSKTAYLGTDLAAVAACLPDYELPRDLLVDIATHLGYAYKAARQFEQLYTLTFRGRELIVPSLERAFREVLHIRRDVPVELVSDDVQRPFTLSRYGRIIKHKVR